MKKRLYDEFIKRLIAVNDETVSDQDHDRLRADFYGWKQGVQDAAGHLFNGDYYYIDLADKGEMEERPMCCGLFLDWKSKVKENGNA